MRKHMLYTEIKKSIFNNWTTRGIGQMALILPRDFATVKNDFILWSVDFTYIPFWLKVITDNS